MQTFLTKWNNFFTEIASFFTKMTMPLFIAVLVYLFIQYGTASPNKKEDAKKNIMIAIIALIGVFSVGYVIPWIVNFWSN